MLQIIHLCCLQTSWLYLSKRKNCVFCGISWHVMRCWPLPPQKKKKKMVTPLPSPKNFQPSPPQSSNFLLPSSNWKWLLLHFYTWLLPTSTFSHFWSYYNWVNAVIIFFWRSWNNTLKKHVFTIILFNFLCVMTCLLLTLHKKLFKIFQRKCINCEDGWEKTSYPGISAEGYRRKYEVQVASKKV